jgi:hypothetical protein
VGERKGSFFYESKEMRSDEVMSHEFLVNHDEKRLEIELICFFPGKILLWFLKENFSSFLSKNVIIYISQSRSQKSSWPQL